MKLGRQGQTTPWNDLPAGPRDLPGMTPRHGPEAASPTGWQLNDPAMKIEQQEGLETARMSGL